VRPAKTASAGILLALALAALALAGCGGGASDGSSSASSSPDAANSDAASTTAQSGGRGAGSGASAATDAGNTPNAAAGGGSAAPGGQPSAGGKHGPHIVQPKGEPEPGITPQQRNEVTVASMSLQSPSAQGGSGLQALPAEFTCDGKNTSPALRWQGVPPGTAELVLFAMNIQPVEEKLFFDWAVAGLSPELEEIEAGKLPKGAVAGRNSFGKTGYGLCPEAGSDETYMFALYAIPKRLSPSQGFEPLAVRKAVTEASGNVGLLALSYARG
jgi:phosphatidylethanolamine-binding protein (PEBP) family uncharacterized protein